MSTKVKSAAPTRSKGRRNLCFAVLILILTVITFAPMIWVPHHVAALKKVQFSFVWPSAEELATVKVGDRELRVVPSRQGSLELGTEIVAQEPDQAAGSASRDKALSKARAANFGVLTNLGLLAAAFVLAALVSIWISLISARAIDAATGAFRGRFQLLSVVVAGAGLLAGAVLVLLDPAGPIVTQDVVLAGWDWTFFDPNREAGPNPIVEAIAHEIVHAQTARGVSYLILACGALGGIASFCFLLYVFAVLSGGSRPDGGKDEDSAAMLRARRENLPLCVTSASLALSLGVTVINAFLGWGLGFLDDASREVAAIIVDASTVYYGGTIAIAAVTGSALAFFCLRFDIDAAASAACRTDSDGEPISHLDWMKNNDLEFEPLKAVSTFVVALGPVLTSGLLEVLGKSVA